MGLLLFVMGVIHHFKGSKGAWDWEGVPVHDYGNELPGVTVRRFISRQDGSSKIEMRYFELKPGANSNLETHNYDHAVLILRGNGSVRMGNKTFPVKAGDALFVPANEIHQFKADSNKAFGFLCTIIDKGLHESVYGNKKPGKQVC